MEIGEIKQPLGFGLSIVNRYTRNRKLHAKDTIRGILASVKNLKMSTIISYRYNAHKVAEEAFQAGFRIFDTARVYGYSEAELGKMIKCHRREEVFVCTKVSDMDLWRAGGSATVRGNLMNSLKDLQTDYVDLYLLHWPSGEWVEMYRQMDELYKEGLTKHIGVSNFQLSDFKKLSESGDYTKPQFCQLECHPFCMHKDVLDYCKENGIIVLAHTPTGRMTANIRSNEVLLAIAKKYNKSVAQVMLRWHVQEGRIPITHTKNANHIKENMNIFDFTLTSDELEKIDGLNQENPLFKTVGIDNPNYKYNK